MNDSIKGRPSSCIDIRRALGALLFFLCLCHGPVRAQFAGGTGTLDEPYLISSAEQLNAIGMDPNHWDKHFKLTADIDLSAYPGRRFSVIGALEVPFRGVFDGNGHAISNFGYYAITAIEQLPCSEVDLIRAGQTSSDWTDRMCLETVEHFRLHLSRHFEPDRIPVAGGLPTITQLCEGTDYDHP